MYPLNLRGSIHDHCDGSQAMLPILNEKYGAETTQRHIAAATQALRGVSNGTTSISNLFRIVYGALKTKETLERLGYLYGQLRFQQGCIKAEPIFAPQYLLDGGLTMQGATAAIYDGFKKAQRDFGIEITPVIAIGRETTVLIGETIARIACDYDGKLMLDLVCDEINNPPEKFLSAYRLTFGTKVKRLCHVEVVAPRPTADYHLRLRRNLETALFDLKCHGLQHGSGLIQHPDLIKYVVDNSIRVAGCPLSNIGLGLIKNITEIGIDQLLDAGVWYTIGADDDLFLPNLSETVSICNAAYQFSESHCQQLEANVLRKL